MLSGHAVYRTMLVTLINLAAATRVAADRCLEHRAIILGLNEWFRKSELSAIVLDSCTPGSHRGITGACEPGWCRNPNEIDMAGFLDQAEGV